jgi:uncharacterized membrane protein YesL
VFSINGVLYRFCNKLHLLAYLNILFLISCLPLITIPAATAALFGVSRKLIQGDEQSIFTLYRQLFVGSFRRSLGVGLFTIIIGLCLLINFHLLTQIKTSLNPVFFISQCFLGCLFIITMLYLFPLMVNRNFSLKQLIIKSFTIGVYKFHITVINLIFLVVLLFLSLRFSFLLVVLYFSVSAYITCLFYNQKVEKIIKESDGKAFKEKGKKHYKITFDKTGFLG